MQPESEEILAHDTSFYQNQSTSKVFFKKISIIASFFINADLRNNNHLIVNSVRMLSQSIHSGWGYLCKISYISNDPVCTEWWVSDKGNRHCSVFPDIKQNSWIKTVIENKIILFVNFKKTNQTHHDGNLVYITQGQFPLVYIPVVKNNQTTGIICFGDFLITPKVTKSIVHAFRIAAVMFANILYRIAIDNDGASDPAEIETYIKNIEQENKELKKCITLKSEFVSVISHELRTPLTGIIGLTQTLRLSDLSLSKQEIDYYLEIIESEGKRLAHLIKDLSDMSLLESENFQLSYSYFDIILLIKEVITLISSIIKFNYTISSFERNAVWLNADRDRIKQVLIILFDNALKHSRNQTSVGIVITCNEQSITTEISDQGPGIMPEEKEKIFEKFYRTKTGGYLCGSGLGLTIAKNIVNAHGGKIWVESDPGNGSTFLFTI